MTKHMNEFTEDLRLKLANIESGFDALKAKIDSKAEHSEQDVRKYLDEVRHRIKQGEAKVTAAQSEMKHWVEEHKNATREKIAEWRAKRETTKLQKRADKAEQYSAAAIVLAAAALDEAERSVLEAWLARHDADVATAK